MKRRLFNRAAASARQCWQISNVGTDEAEIRLYDEIGFWEDSSAKAFADALKSITANTIHLRVNSPGGYITDAMAMYQQLKDHPAKVITHIDGICASAATYPALAGDDVVINRGGMFMIHDPLAGVWGNSSDLRQEADLLDKFKESIVAVYANETGNDSAALTGWMTAETWFTAEDAVKHGFADSIANESGEPSNRFDLSVYRNVPNTLNGTPKQPQTVREMERFLRDAGLSNSAAKSLASAAKGNLNLRDEDEDAAFIQAMRQRFIDLRK
jgi:ATP-dependent Clp protease protease subunit